MITAHRRNSTNERHEKEALEQIARLVESYESEVRSEARNSYPNQHQPALGTGTHVPLPRSGCKTRLVTLFPQRVNAPTKAACAPPLGETQRLPVRVSDRVPPVRPCVSSC